MNETKDFTNLQKREEELFAQFLEKNNKNTDTPTNYDGDKKIKTGITHNDSDINNIKDFLPDFTELENHTKDNAWEKLSVFLHLSFRKDNFIKITAIMIPVISSTISSSFFV